VHAHVPRANEVTMNICSAWKHATVVALVFLMLLAGARAAELRIATCQFPISDQVSANAEWIRKQMREAKAQGAEIVHFPETALSGYGGVDHASLAGFPWARQREELEKILALARELRVWVVLGANHPLSGANKPHNSLYVIDPAGTIVDRYDKRFCTTGDL